MKSLPKSTLRRVRDRIRSFEEDPYRNAAKLRRGAGFRARVGDHRIIYQVDDKQRTVFVTGIHHRREAYR